MSLLISVMRKLVLLSVFVLLTSQSGRAESQSDKTPEEQFSIEAGLDIATGKYGGSISTTTISIPLSINYYPNKYFDFGASVPYIHQNTNLIVGGRVVTGTAARNVKSTNNKVTVSGFGDLLLDMGYTFSSESLKSFQVRPVATLKLPTADAGLGSGAVSEILGVGLTKNIDKWLLFMDGDYAFQGKTALYTAKNYVDYDAGIGYEITPGLRPSLAIKGATSAQEGVSGNLQLEGKLIYAVSSNCTLKLYIDRGYSSTSPDWEGSFTINYGF